MKIDSHLLLLPPFKLIAQGEAGTVLCVPWSPPFLLLTGPGDIDNPYQ